MDLIDIGANLTHDSFEADFVSVLARAAAAGVRRLIVTGTSVTSSAQATALCETHAGTLFATAGIHPHHARECDRHSIGVLRALLGNPAVVAVGECGLDYYRDYSPRSAQRAAFEAQLALAVDCGKPVFLHQRDAHEDFVSLLTPVRPRLAGGVAHCFTGGPRELAAYLELGLYIGVTGWVCDERRGAELRSALPALPLDRLLLETDAPYLLPRDLRPAPPGRRNEPAYLAHVAARVAAETGKTAAEIAAASTANAERLFSLPSGASAARSAPAPLRP